MAHVGRQIHRRFDTKALIITAALVPAAAIAGVFILAGQRSRSVALWIVAGLLATAHVDGGGGKLIIPKDKIAAFGPSARWVEDFSTAGVKA